MEKKTNTKPDYPDSALTVPYHGDSTKASGGPAPPPLRSPSADILPGSIPTRSGLTVDANPNDEAELEAVVEFVMGSSNLSRVSPGYREILDSRQSDWPYNKAEKYWAPNDRQEVVRLNLQHHLFRLSMGGRLYDCPVEEPKSCLDIATGTGMWAVEFAEEHPSCTVVASDISDDAFPTGSTPNLTFVTHDAEEEQPWPYKQQFDFVHARAILTSFKDNRAVAKAIFDAVTPGGYVEVQDPTMPLLSDDGTLDGTALGEWSDLMIAGMARTGRRLNDAPNWASYMREAGFEGVVERRYVWPCGAWCEGAQNKIEGVLCQRNLLDGSPGMITAVCTHMLGWEAARAKTFVERVKADLRNRDVHAYAEMYVAYGRKPLESKS